MTNVTCKHNFYYLFTSFPSRYRQKAGPWVQAASTRRGEPAPPVTRKRRQMKQPTAQHGDACMERDIIVAVVFIFIITLYWKRDSAKRDSAKRDSAKRDSAKRDSAKRDSAKRDSAKRDSAKREDTCACILFGIIIYGASRYLFGLFRCLFGPFRSFLVSFRSCSVLLGPFRCL